jgi:transcriptional regulator with XRE-family HTH domain
MFPWENDMDPEVRLMPRVGKAAKTPVARQTERKPVKPRILYLGPWLLRLNRKPAHVAAALGCTPGYLSALISNKYDKNPSTEFMLALSEELGVSINALFEPPPARDVAEGAHKLTDRQYAALLEVLAHRGTRRRDDD